MTRRPKRFPFTRLGLLLIVGSVIASVVRWYVSYGESLADIGSDISTERADMWRDFQQNFLFAGSVPGRLFWAGIAVMIVGIVRNFWPARR